MPMTLKDQILVARALKYLTGAKRWSKSADLFAEMESRLEAEAIRAEQDDAARAEAERINRAPMVSDPFDGTKGVRVLDRTVITESATGPSMPAATNDRPPLEICDRCSNPADCASWQSCHNKGRGIESDD